MSLQSGILSLFSSGSARPILVISRHHSAVAVIRSITQELGFKLFHLIGSEVKDKSTLLEALNRTMRFPGYFGGNWDALEECLRDLEWSPAEGYVILYEEPQRLLEMSYDVLVTFLEVVVAVSEEWARDQVFFCLILVGGEELIDLQKHESIKQSIQFYHEVQ